MSIIRNNDQDDKKQQKPKKRFNFYWLYGIAAVLFGAVKLACLTSRRSRLTAMGTATIRRIGD